MGLMDFFKKGKETPVEKKPDPVEHKLAQPRTPETNADQRREYTIQSGDSLSKIARQFYGDANGWQRIFDANKEKIKDPNLIHPGQKIVIP